MLKFISEDSYILIKINRRSTQTDNQVENCCGYDIFIDEISSESSEYSCESDED